MSTTGVLLTDSEQHRAEALTRAVETALDHPPEEALLVFVESVKGNIRRGDRAAYRPRCQPVARTASPVVRVWPVVVDISPPSSARSTSEDSDD